MIFYDRIQDSLKYIEDNLDKDCSLEAVAKASGMSLSHFYKIFLAATGFTVKEYIRNKLLSRAASQLTGTNRRIIDIAVDAGFNSHEVFTRAFTQLYGVSPRNYRRLRKETTIFEKHSFFGEKISEKYRHVKENIGISVKVLNREEIILVGMELQTSVQETIEKNIIPIFWRDDFIPRIPDIKYIKQPFVSIGYEIHNPEKDELYHMACVEAAYENIPEGMVCKVIPPAEYVVFSTKKALDPIEYSTLVQYIYGEWLPMSGYETASDFTMDMNYSNCYYSDKYYIQALNTDSRLEVYIPVK